ncbi:MAG: hypothetical protein R2800_00260 [Flavipsychrobacter sp.]
MEEFYIGGYYLVEGTSLHDYMNSSVLPNKIWSVSNCICNIHPNLSALSWSSCSDEDRLAYKQKLSLTKEEFQLLQEETDNLFNDKKVGWVEMFTDREASISFAKKHLTNIENIKLLMIATSAEYRNRFLQQAKTEEANTGVHHCLQKGNMVENNDNFKGFDILGFELGSFHSFICNSLETEFTTKLYITLNENGLINSYTDAQKANDYMLDPYYTKEHILWMPWAVYELQL